MRMRLVKFIIHLLSFQKDVMQRESKRIQFIKHIWESALHISILESKQATFKVKVNVTAWNQAGQQSSSPLQPPLLLQTTHLTEEKARS